MSRLDRYAKIKSIAYLNYLIDYSKCINRDSDELVEIIDNSDLTQNFLESLSSEEVKIYENTIKFPFDSVLAQSLLNKNLTTDSLSIFELDSDFVALKVKEYLQYSYLTLVDNNFNEKFTQFSNKLSDIWVNEVVGNRDMSINNRNMK